MKYKNGKTEISGDSPDLNYLIRKQQWLDLIPIGVEFIKWAGLLIVCCTHPYIGGALLAGKGVKSIMPILFKD